MGYWELLSNDFVSKQGRIRLLNSFYCRSAVRASACERSPGRKGMVPRRARRGGGRVRGGAYGSNRVGEEGEKGSAVFGLSPSSTRVWAVRTRKDSREKGRDRGGSLTVTSGGSSDKGAAHKPIFSSEHCSGSRPSEDRSRVPGGPFGNSPVALW